MVKTLSLERVLSVVPQGSDLGPVLFLIYINDLPDDIQSICKIFADDTALFSKCKDFKKSERELNEDLAIIKEWACQWKMDFDPDPKKQATEVCFSHKILNNNPKLLSFNGSQVKTYERHNHLGVILNTKLTFKEHLENKIVNCTRIIDSIKKLSVLIPRTCLLTVYKAFVRPHPDYDDVIYDKFIIIYDNESFKDWLEKIQYNAALAITGVTRGTSRERIYNELDKESLADKGCYKK